MYIVLNKVLFIIINNVNNILIYIVINYYYLMIFCTVYHKSQGSIMVNYITGIAESMAISFGLTVITSLIRFLSLKYKWKNIYNTSKYLFDHF